MRKQTPGSFAASVSIQADQAEARLPTCMSVRDAAKVLNCCERHLRGEIAARRIEVLRHGRKYVITPAALEAYILKIAVPALDLESDARRTVG